MLNIHDTHELIQNSNSSTQVGSVKLYIPQIN